MGFGSCFQKIIINVLQRCGFKRKKTVLKKGRCIYLQTQITSYEAAGTAIFSLIFSLIFASISLPKAGLSITNCFTDSLP